MNIDRVILVRRTASGSLGAGHVPRALVEEALARGLLTPKGAAQFVLAPLPPAPPRAGRAEGSVRPEPSPQRGPEAESPSLWLHRRKGPDGLPLLDDVHGLRGERFRWDVTLAAMPPSVTTDCSRMETSMERAAPRDPVLASDVTIAAPQRVRVAFRRLGSGMGHFVLDTCGFLVPLQEAGARRGWPARSGKLALRRALDQLAEHCGLGQTAVGPARGRMTGWQSEGSRPDLSVWLREGSWTLEG
ncbi:MAG: DUF6456 domain-containing protein [Hyphomicrobiales bacterium]|nr:DUF6456 domain-containing protein [Hyphomicrobiales bacterium]